MEGVPTKIMGQATVNLKLLLKATWPEFQPPPVNRGGG